MRKIKEVLRLKFENGRSIRQISKSCSIGRSTAADYIGRAERAGLIWPLPADLDDKAIEALLYPSVKNGSPEKRSMPSMEYLYRELGKKSVTLNLLWYEYKQAKPEGYIINRKRVQRLMRKMGIQSIAPKPGTSKPHPEHKIYPYLLRHLSVIRPNQVWSTDITYIPLVGGFVYLVAVIDWFSRYVLSWEVSVNMESEFCISALESAIRRYDQPEIFNTDQGAQFTCNAFTNILKENEVMISMDGRGRALDNVFIERLWRSVKYEEIYPKEYRSVRELILSLKRYFDFYNDQRPHASLNRNTPSEVYSGCLMVAM